jgi:membrane fusion protein, multidrug efflux system
VRKGQKVITKADAFPGREFNGTITAVNSRVETQTRNVRVEARIANPGRELLPGMFVTVEIQAGESERFLTLPRTAVTFNPYGETVYVVENKGKDGKQELVARQVFVAVSSSRGDQVAVTSGIKEGDTVVTSGQLKIKSGSVVVIDNRVQPSSDPNPKPEDK